MDTVGQLIEWLRASRRCLGAGPGALSRLPSAPRWTRWMAQPSTGLHPGPRWPCSTGDGAEAMASIPGGCPGRPLTWRQPGPPWARWAARRAPARTSSAGSDDPQGEPLQALRLEHYPGMTEQAMRRLAETACGASSWTKVLMWHRCGDLRVAIPSWWWWPRAAHPARSPGCGRLPDGSPNPACRSGSGETHGGGQRWVPAKSSATKRRWPAGKRAMTTARWRPASLRLPRFMRTRPERAAPDPLRPGQARPGWWTWARTRTRAAGGTQACCAWPRGRRPRGRGQAAKGRCAGRGPHCRHHGAKRTADLVP